MIQLSQKRDVAVSAGFCHPACNNNIFMECLSYIGILDFIYIWISTFISAALTTSAIISNVKKKSFDIFLNKYYNPFRYTTLDTSASECNVAYPGFFMCIYRDRGDDSSFLDMSGSPLSHSPIVQVCKYWLVVYLDS